MEKMIQYFLRMHRWNPRIVQVSNPSAVSEAETRYFCSIFLNVWYTVDVDTLTLPDVWTSRVICKVDFKGLLGISNCIFIILIESPGSTTCMLSLDRTLLS